MTFSHNLFANSDSRNPRVGDLAQLDFVNNVIFNPGFRYGYSSGRQTCRRSTMLRTLASTGPAPVPAVLCFYLSLRPIRSLFFGKSAQRGKNGILDETVASTSSLVAERSRFSSARHFAPSDYHRCSYRLCKRCESCWCFPLSRRCRSTYRARRVEPIWLDH